MPVSGHPIPRPQRQRPDTMGCAVEASPKRLRNHLRRPDADEDQLIMKPPLTPLIGQTRGKKALWLSGPSRHHLGRAAHRRVVIREQRWWRRDGTIGRYGYGAWNCAGEQDDQ